MRPMNNKRGRGGRGAQNGGRRNHHHQQHSPNRSYDSNGPDVKIRGNAVQIYDRYCQLARDALASGDRILAESYLQHAEHYFRIMLAIGMGPRPQGQPNGQGEGQPSEGQPADGQPADGQPVDGRNGEAFAAQPRDNQSQDNQAGSETAADGEEQALTV